MAKRRTQKKGNQKRQAVGVLLLGVSALLFLAAASYNINDPVNLNAANDGIPVKNWLGPLGASVSHFMIQWTLGYPVIVIPVIMVLFSFSLIRINSNIKLAYLSILLLSWSLLLSIILALPEAIRTMGNIMEYYPSGLIGGWLAGKLVVYTGKFGSLAVLFLLTIALLVYSVRVELNRIISSLSGAFSGIRFFISKKFQNISDNIKQRRKRKKIRSAVPKSPAEPVVVIPEADTGPVLPQRELPKIEFDEPSAEPATNTEPLKQTSLDDILDGMEPVSEEGQPAELGFDVKEAEQNKELDYDSLVKESIARFKFPSTDLLADPPENTDKVSREELRENAELLESKLLDYGVEAKVTSVTAGPVITMYELQPAKGVKVNSIVNLANDLALAMEARGIRILAPIPGKAAVGIEIPNRNPQIVYLKSLIRSPKYSGSNLKLPVALGKTINGKVYVTDLTAMPHLLIGGATNSGKSVGINSIIMSLIYAIDPGSVKFVMVDPKKLELSLYKKLVDHYLLWRPDIDEEVITTPKNAVSMLHSIVLEMERRYDQLAELGVRNIVEYNEKISDMSSAQKTGNHRRLPYIVVIIDELADLMLVSAKDVEGPITRLAQMARAVGIHLILATQRPSVNVITGVIKANFPARIAFNTRTKVDSRTILDMMGAEQLIGNGDMLYLPPDRPNPIRLQNPLVTTSEVKAVLNHIRRQPKLPSYSLPQPEAGSGRGTGNSVDAGSDALYKDARAIVVQHKQGSTSLLQRRLGIGYARAARLMDHLQENGIVGPPDGSKPREVLITLQELDGMP